MTTDEYLKISAELRDARNRSFDHIVAIRWAITVLRLNAATDPELNDSQRLEVEKALSIMLKTE